MLSNVLIGEILSWLLEQEICKLLNSCLWVAMVIYLGIYLNSKVSANIQKIFRIILPSGLLYKSKSVVQFLKVLINGNITIIVIRNT